MLIWIVSSLSLSGAAALFLISLMAARFESIEFFPPPRKNCWQHAAFIWLFRLYLYPLIGLSLLVIEPIGGQRAIFQYSAGAALLFVGFGFAFWITFKMGWHNAFGEKAGLKTDGWFRWSRNPIYVATWIGLLGWGLIANNAHVSTLLLLWALMYLAAPLAEEPWLEKQYGDAYREYKARTRRFV